MTRESITNTLFVLLVVAAVAVAILWCEKRLKSPDSGHIESIVDTLYIHDTIKVTEAVSVEKTVVRTDTVVVPVDRIIKETDTVYVLMEREQIRWEDSLSVIYASGILPHIDSVFHYRTQMIITKEIPVKVRSRWGIGVQAGYGVSRDGLSPYIGVGVSYNLLSW